jgi:hypothetical protein
MTRRSGLRRRWVAAMAMAAVTPAALSGTAAASGVGQHDVARVEDAKAAVADLVEVATKGPADAVPHRPSSHSHRPHPRGVR